MVQHFTQQKGVRRFFLSIAALIIFSLAAFSPLAANAQLSPFGYGYPGLFTTPFGIQPQASLFGLGALSYQQQASRYAHANSFLGSTNGLLADSFNRLPISQPMVSMAPRLPNAFINGATTVFIPASATDLRVVVKVPGVTSIKLSSLVAPLTVFVYPTGYIPPTSPVVPVAPALPVVTPAATAPTTTVSAPAAISGLLRRVSFPSFSPLSVIPGLNQPYPYWNGYNNRYW